MNQANPVISKPVESGLAPSKPHRQLRASWCSLNDVNSRIEAWTHLENNAIWRNPSFEHNYLIPAIQNLGTPSIRILMVEDNAADESENIVGLLPIESKYIFRLPFKCAEVWKHEHCFDATPLLLNKFPTEAWQLICNKLASDGYSLLSLDTVSAESSFEQVLRQTQSNLNFHRFQRDHYERAGFIPSASADEYSTNFVSKSIRKNVKRLMRKLEELGDVRWECSHQQSDYDFLAAEFLRIESSGWKGREGTALASSDETKSFYLDLIRRSASANKARFLTLYLNDQPIAMLSDIQSGLTVYSYKTAFDDAFSQYSPGLQVEVKNIELLHRDGIEFGDSCTNPDNTTVNRIWGQKVKFQNVVFSLTPGLNRLATRLMPSVQNAVRRFKKNK